MAPLIKSFETICQEQIDPMYTNEGWLQSFQKAMSAFGISGYGDVGPLLLEDLDSTMTSILFEKQHLKLWQAIPRVPAAQIYYEYNRRKGYGLNRRAPGFREGGAPTGGVSEYERLGEYIRFLGVRRGVTHQLSLIGTGRGIQLDPVAEENQNGTLTLLELCERWQVWGDEDIEDNSGNTVNYDGIIQQVTDGSPGNIIDWQGQPPDLDMFEGIAYRLFQDTKLADFSQVKAFMDGRVLTGLTAQQRDIERRLVSGQRPPRLVPGEPLKGVETNFGHIPFIPSVFMQAVEGNRVLATADSDAPAAPATVAGVAGTGGSPGLPEATYSYAVSAVDDDGESLPTDITSDVVVANPNNKVTLTIARSADATFYRVYRYDEPGGTAYYIGLVVQPASGDATFVDQNEWHPDTSICVIGNFVQSDIACAQLAPLLKFPLAYTSTTMEFLLLLYHTLVVKAHERFFVIKNIGEYTVA